MSLTSGRPAGAGLLIATLTLVALISSIIVLTTNKLSIVHAKELLLVESKRPFIDFDIKHLNFNVESRKRAFIGIKEPALGASYLHESLFTNNKYARCSAYGLLFKLINDSEKNKSTQIRLSTVQELAVVVQRNLSYYYKLLIDNVPEYVDHFKRAAEHLLYSKRHNQYANSRDAALDLINCVKDIDTSQAGSEQLSGLEREINLWLMFKSEPIRSKKLKPARRQSAIEFANAEFFYQEALKSIGSLDFNTKVNLANRKPEQTIYTRKNSELKPNGTLIESHEPLGVNLYLDKPVTEEEASLRFPSFHREQLKILNFVRFRLVDFKNGRNFPIDVQLAIDFQTHWQALKSYIDNSLNPNKSALDFYRNKDHSKLAKSIAYNLKLYNRFSLVFYRLSRKNFKFPSIKGYCNAVSKTKESLNKINKFDLIDIDDIYRIYDFWFSTHEQTCNIYWPATNKIFEIDPK